MIIFYTLTKLLPTKEAKYISDIKKLMAPLNVSELNILFITLDTTRADHLGCYGYERLMQLDHRDFKPPMNLGDIYLEMKNIDKAIPFLQYNRLGQTDKYYEELQKGRQLQQKLEKNDQQNNLR